MTIKFIGRSEKGQEVSFEFATSQQFAVFLLLHHLHSQTLNPQPNRPLTIAVSSKEGEYLRSIHYETVYAFLLSVILRSSNEGVYDFCKDVVIGADGEMREAESDRPKA